MTPAEYHADTAISQSAYKDFMSEEGGRMLYFGRYVSGLFPRRKLARNLEDVGDGFEAMLDMGGPTKVRMIPSKIKTRNGKAWDDFVAMNPGCVLLKEDQYRAVCWMVASCMSHPLAKTILENAEGRSQVALKWTDEETGLPLKALLDWLQPRCIADLKTAVSVTDHHIQRQVANLGYDVQGVWYQEAASQVLGLELPFVDLFVCKNPPYQCRVVQLAPEYSLAVAEEVRDGLRQLAECYRTGNWGGTEEEALILNRRR